MTALNYFTPANEQDVFRTETSEKSSSQTHSILSGEEARQFYESLMDDNDVSRKAISKSRHGKEQKKNRSARRGVRGRISDGGVQGDQTTSGTISEGGNIQSREATASESRNSERTKELQGLRLLRCAHEGDISGMKELVSKGVDINFQDSFFWTAVMCACWSGQRAAVRLLLQQGAAWVGVVDTLGRDAKDLALAAGHRDVLEELENFGRSAQRDTQPDSSATQSQWCDVCDSHYSGSLSSHLSSTLHQFSLRRPPPTPQYCLPSSSTGYKMMVRCGWKPGAGLGPEGAGPKRPVPTVLKRDQKGLGYGPTKRAKVTHFLSRDHDAVKLPPKQKEERNEFIIRLRHIRQIYCDDTFY
ncbi:hypothetical protein LDENG_00213660 [Lucifuga dentata]|nr:hypothetical protein LDENG_00213660 [Lucifuga dentata]